MTSPAASYLVEVQNLASQHTAVVHETFPMSEIGSFMGRAFSEAGEYLGRTGVPMVGPPFSHYLRMPTETVDVEAGFPTSTPVTGGGRVTASTLPGGPVAVTTYYGPYEGVGAAYEAILRWIGENGRQAAGHFWEVYYTDPTEEPDPAKWRTDVFVPLLA